MRLWYALLWSSWMEVSNDVHFAVGWILTQNHKKTGCLWLSVVFGKIVTKIKYIWKLFSCWSQWCSPQLHTRGRLALFSGPPSMFWSLEVWKKVASCDWKWRRFANEGSSWYVVCINYHSTLDSYFQTTCMTNIQLAQWVVKLSIFCPSFPTSQSCSSLSFPPSLLSPLLHPPQNLPKRVTCLLTFTSLTLTCSSVRSRSVL